MGLLAGPVAAQPKLKLPKLNARLKHELDSIYEVDQRYRVLLFVPGANRNPDSLAAKLGVKKEELGNTLFQRMMQADYTNLVRVQAIIKQYGYPGTSLVGAPTNEAAWHVIQHSPTIAQYLPAMKQAAEKGELPYFRYAQMLDRQLMQEGKEQLYGTQGLNYNITNPATGQRESQPPFIWPIKDPAQVNRRRKQAGFKTTVEESAAEMRIPYRVVTLEEVAKMPKQ